METMESSINDAFSRATQLPDPPPHRYTRIITIAVVLLITLIVIAFIFLLRPRQELPKQTAPPILSPSPILTPIQSVPSGWTTRNSTVCFLSFSYPASWAFTLEIERHDNKEHTCTYYLKSSPEDTYTTISINTMAEDSITTQLTASVATGPQIPIQIVGADESYRITTANNIQGLPLETPVITVIITRGKKAYSVSYEETAENKQIFDGIIQSVRLTGTDHDYLEPFKEYSILKKMNDATVQGNLRAIADGLDYYFSDHGSYPNDLHELMSGYIRALPKDPSTKRGYLYETDTTYYILRATDGAGMPLVIDSRIPSALR